MAIIGNQLRAARMLVGLEQQKLADAADVSLNTIRNMEAKGTKFTRVREETMERIADALHGFGVKFCGQEDGLFGVQLIKPPPEFVALAAARRRRRKSDTR